MRGGSDAGGRPGNVMQAPVKVRRVDLVRVDDPAYVEEMSRQAAAHRRLGPRHDPGDLYRASALIETAVRQWLALRLPLLEERIIDADVLPPGERAYVRRFQELDGVVGRDGVPDRVIEMKFSASGGAVRRGMTQLGRAQSLLRHRWTGVAGLLVLVEANRTGVELDLERLRDVDVIAPEALDRPGSLAAMTLLVLAVHDLGDHLDADARALVKLGHDEGDALTAARMARAARAVDDDAAVQEDVATPERRVEAPPSATFGGDDADEPDASPFAALAGWRPGASDEAETPSRDG